jgi:NCAIR mutase (PurE)-related protein
MLADVGAGRIEADEAARRLRRLPFVDLGFARVDHHRSVRQGLAEAVYAPGKTPAQCAAIVTELLDGGDEPILLTRTDDDQAAAALAANGGGARFGTLCVWQSADEDDGPDAVVVIVTAGTADLPVADEADAVLGAHGVKAERITDAGVAGIHRLLASTDALAEADAVIVVAGMEGALASVVGGITGAPVVAVPTSVGYGSALDGVTALLSMHASCAAGITVVGIDNGYGAAIATMRMLLRR